MKILMRTSIILAAALVVVGLTFGISKTSYVQNLFPTTNFERQLPVSTTTTVDSTQTSAGTTTETSVTSDTATTQPQFERDHEEPSGIFGLLQVGQNFGIMSLIVLPFALWPWFVNRNKKVAIGGQHSAG
ncbi:MAG: hypothetical protein U0175_09715 [Caldilineaceae bacterium]